MVIMGNLWRAAAARRLAVGLRALLGLGAPQLLGLDAAAVSSKFAALEASLGSRDAARAEALRKPASLELEVRGSKRGSVAA